jgi:uncharacterized protein YdaU (DUF1376 family)
MAKDPAFLFYPGDWLGGTMSFTRSHKGAYMDLLMAQFNQGHMALQDIQIVLGTDYESMWESKLKAKFKLDEKGLFYNEKLEDEIIKRKKFTQSRRDNLESKTSHKETHTASRMENENENINESNNIIKEKTFFEKARVLYPGTKRGLETEFENFKKKHKDWKQVVLILEEKIQAQIRVRDYRKGLNEFVPEWKNFSTWINQRCWEEEIQAVEAKTENKPLQLQPGNFLKSK